MNRALLLLVALASCDPVWAINVSVRDPADWPVAGATVALACEDHAPVASSGFAVKTDNEGRARLGGFGSMLPLGCDLYVAKPGLAPLRIRYRELCPDWGNCERVFDFALVAAPCPTKVNDASSAGCYGFRHRLRAVASP